MNRIQFWILIAASSLVVVLLLLQMIFSQQAQSSQKQLLGAQQEIQQGRLAANRFNQLANRVAQISQQTQDQGLKDLLVRQQISVQIQANPASAGASSAPAPVVPPPLTR